MTKKLALSENDLIKSICKESFFEFVKEFWETIIPETPIWNWHIEYICDEVQIVVERIIKGEKATYDLLINVPPGSTKSTLISVMLVPWVWTKFPQFRFIGVSYAAALSLELSRKSRSIIESDKYQAIFDVTLKRDQNTKSHWSNTKGGDRYAVGTGGAVTGMHAHLLAPDDPINPLEANSDAERLAANTYIRETLSSRKVDKQIACMVVVMQRLHQNDPAGEMIERSEKEKGMPIRHICLPSEKTKDVKPAKLKRKYKDGLLDPVRMPKKVLEKEETVLGDYGYAGQHLQNPIPRGGGLIKVDRFVHDLPPKRFVEKVRYWDKAGTMGGGAYTVGALLAKDYKGRFWLLDIVRGQWSTEKREQTILNTAKADGRSIRIGIEQEPGSGGKESAEATVRMLAGYVVRVDIPRGDKATRADPYSVQVNNGNVSVKENAPWWADYKAECQFFPNSKYKDQVDASSGGFSMLTTGITVGAF